jgi:hypothetical protein
VDTRDYELLKCVEAGQFSNVGARGEHSDLRYVTARLLQLRARGLVQLVAGADDDSDLLSRWGLTASGRETLAQRRRGDLTALRR